MTLVAKNLAMNQLDQLRGTTTIVADTGDFQQLARFAPRDATTNPTLILKAVLQPQYQPILEETVARYRGESHESIVDRVLTRFGLEILSIVPGRVSVEVDARRSFDAPAMLASARRIISFFDAHGIGPDRVLIKLAATWEGICAARILEREGIRCNLTLVFHLCQAVACAAAHATLISPFVGRIYDWHKRDAAATWVEAANCHHADPGVRSVAAILRYFRRFEIGTEVMGASFRNTGQVLALAGCDLLTISPELLEQLRTTRAATISGVSLEPDPSDPPAQLHFDEAAFRHALNDSAMATEKLAEGIRNFAADAVLLDKLIGSIRAHATPS